MIAAGASLSWIFSMWARAACRVACHDLTRRPSFIPAGMVTLQRWRAWSKTGSAIVFFGMIYWG
jgi:hypothetical protein